MIRTGLKTYVAEVRGDDPQTLIRDLAALEIRANALHLFPAARALNNAKNAIGWQVAGNIAKADEAATHRD